MSWRRWFGLEARSTRPQPPSFKILLIVGVPRSGTTFLQIVLGSHPSIATGRETHLFDIYLGPLLKLYDQEEEMFKSADGIRYYITRHGLQTHFRAIALSIFDAIRLGKPGASVVLEKTPGHLMHLPTIAECLPEARFIHIVRDPRGIAASMKAASSEEWGHWAHADAGKVATKWLAGMAFANDHASALGKAFRQIRYEDLFVDGGTIINGLLYWLGLPPLVGLSSDLRIDFPISAMANTEKSLTDPSHESRANFFRKGDPDSWRSELTADEIAAIEAVCAKEMRVLGYKPAGSSAGSGRIAGS